jgi:hypothetical protein
MYSRSMKCLEKSDTYHFLSAKEYSNYCIACIGRHFDAVTDALLSNSAYANVHTANFPAGEIRGQIRLERGRNDRDGRWRPRRFGAH